MMVMDLGAVVVFDDVDNASVVVDDVVHLDLLPVIHQLVHLSCCSLISHPKS